MDIQAPYEPGSPQGIYVGGDADAGGRDTVAGTVDGAKANALARASEIESGTYQQGSRLGDLIPLPPAPPPELFEAAEIAQENNSGGFR